MKENKNIGFSRRDFIKTSAAAGAGLFVAPLIRTSGKSPVSNDLNVALLGTGAEGQQDAGGDNQTTESSSTDETKTN